MKLLSFTPILALPLAYGANLALNPGAPVEVTPMSSAKEGEIASGSWTTDNAHTSIGFTVGHLGVSQVHGRFEKTSGKITADPKKIEGSSVTFTIETASINTAVAQRDDHLRTPDFFDAEKYPEIKFVSTNIRRKGTGYVAEGKLTMKDVTRTIQIPFKAYGPITDPWGNQRVGMVSSPFVINRKHFNINYNDKLPDGTPAVSDEVTLRLSLEATLDKDQ